MNKQNRISPKSESGKSSRETSNISKHTGPVTVMELGDIEIDPKTKKNQVKVKQCDNNALEKFLESKLSTKEWRQPLYIRKRDGIFDEEPQKLTGFAGFKYNAKRSWKRMKLNSRDMWYKLEVWGSLLRQIDGTQGTGVLTYFLFLRWLFFLNIVIFILVFIFIVLPMAIFPTVDYNSTVSSSYTASVTLAFTCSALYSPNVSSQASELVLNFLQGTGWMELTSLFYGYYANQDVQFASTSYNYNLPLAYLIVSVVVFTISLIMMTRSTASSFKENLRESAETNYTWWNKTFGSWDFGLSCEKSIEMKYRSIYYDFFSDLEEERFVERSKTRTTGQKCLMYTVRAAVNIIILGLLAGAFYLIYFVTDWSSSYTNSSDVSTKNSYSILAASYLPSLTIALLNVIAPVLFDKIVILERYRQETGMKLTLVRVVFLKLAALGMLVYTIYTTMSCTPKDSCNVGTSTCTALRCWETYVGQQFYMLVIMDFLVAMNKTFVVELIRKLVVKHCSCKVAQLIGYPQFQITQCVLDLIYSQTLIWFGFFFAPLLSGIMTCKLFILFYVKYLSAVYICKPSDRPYKASRSTSVFMMVLLIAFFVCCFPVLYIIYGLEPSKGCGPFRIYTKMYEIVTITIAKWPSFFETIFSIILSASFAVAVMLFLFLVIYYCATKASVSGEMVRSLRQQLHAETKDKAYLICKIHDLSVATLGPEAVQNTNERRRVTPAGKETEKYEERSETKLDATPTGIDSPKPKHLSHTPNTQKDAHQNQTPVIDEGDESDEESIIPPTPKGKEQTSKRDIPPDQALLF